MPEPAVIKIRLKFTYLKSHSYLTGGKWVKPLEATYIHPVFWESFRILHSVPRCAFLPGMCHLLLVLEQFLLVTSQLRISYRMKIPNTQFDKIKAWPRTLPVYCCIQAKRESRGSFWCTKTMFANIWNSILKTRRSCDRHTFIMGIHSLEEF